MLWFDLKVKVSIQSIKRIAQAHDAWQEKACQYAIGLPIMSGADLGTPRAATEQSGGGAIRLECGMVKTWSDAEWERLRMEERAEEENCKARDELDLRVRERT